MGFLGNILWFILGGFLSGLAWIIAGLLWCITIVGIPIGIQCFKLSGLSFFPFRKEVRNDGGTVSFIVNILWIIRTGNRQPDHRLPTLHNNSGNSLRPPVLQDSQACPNAIWGCGGEESRQLRVTSQLLLFKIRVRMLLVVLRGELVPVLLLVPFDGNAVGVYVTIEVYTCSALGEFGIGVQKALDPFDSRIISGGMVNVQEEHIFRNPETHTAVPMLSTGLPGRLIICPCV